MARREHQFLEPDPDRPKGWCERCFAVAWVPVPPGDPDGLEITAGPLRGTFARCDNCWNHEQSRLARLLLADAAQYISEEMAVGREIRAFLAGTSA